MVVMILFLIGFVGMIGSTEMLSFRYYGDENCEEYWWLEFDELDQCYEDWDRDRSHTFIYNYDGTITKRQYSGEECTSYSYHDTNYTEGECIEFDYEYARIDYTTDPTQFSRDHTIPGLITMLQTNEGEGGTCSNELLDYALIDFEECFGYDEEFVKGICMEDDLHMNWEIYDDGNWDCDEDPSSKITISNGYCWTEEDYYHWEVYFNCSQQVPEIKSYLGIKTYHSYLDCTNHPEELYTRAFTNWIFEECGQGDVYDQWFGNSYIYEYWGYDGEYYYYPDDEIVYIDKFFNNEDCDWEYYGDSYMIQIDECTLFEDMYVKIEVIDDPRLFLFENLPRYSDEIVYIVGGESEELDAVCLETGLYEECGSISLPEDPMECIILEQKTVYPFQIYCGAGGEGNNEIIWKQYQNEESECSDDEAILINQELKPGDCLKLKRDEDWFQSIFLFFNCSADDNQYSYENIFGIKTFNNLDSCEDNNDYKLAYTVTQEECSQGVVFETKSGEENSYRYTLDPDGNVVTITKFWENKECGSFEPEEWDTTDVDVDESEKRRRRTVTFEEITLDKCVYFEDTSLIITKIDNPHIFLLENPPPEGKMVYVIARERDSYNSVCTNDGYQECGVFLDFGKDFGICKKGTMKTCEKDGETLRWKQWESQESDCVDDDDHILFDQIVRTGDCVKVKKNDDWYMSVYVFFDGCHYEDPHHNGNNGSATTVWIAVVTPLFTILLCCLLCCCGIACFCALIVVAMLICRSTTFFTRSGGKGGFTTGDGGLDSINILDGSTINAEGNDYLNLETENYGEEMDENNYQN